MSEAARKLADEHGGVWGHHPDHSDADWAQEVGDGNTRQSYWDWVLSQIEMNQ